jgi:hypothetical protein
MSDERKTKYLIKQDRDEFVIEIPSDWKITFATVNPASNGMRDSHCVRVYEMPGSKLRAVFDSAVAIRDLSIPLARKAKTEVGSATWHTDSAGNFESQAKVAVDSRLILEPGIDESPF